VTYVQAHVSPPQKCDHLQKPVLKRSIQITNRSLQYQGKHYINHLKLIQLGRLQDWFCTPDHM